MLQWLHRWRLHGGGGGSERQLWWRAWFIRFLDIFSDILWEELSIKSASWCTRQVSGERWLLGHYNIRVTGILLRIFLVMRQVYKSEIVVIT